MCGSNPRLEALSKNRSWAARQWSRDRSPWHAAHKRFFSQVSSRGFEPDMPVVLERFEVIFQAE